MAEQIVTVWLIEKCPDGTVMVGNSYECPLREAVLLIERGEAKAENLPRGLVPPEWKTTTQGRKSEPGEAE